MRRRRWALVAALAAVLAWPALAAPVNQGEVTARVRAVVSGYAQLVKELNLSQIPCNMPDYPAVSERLDELGTELEALSRLAGRDNPTEEEWRTLDQRSTQAEADLKCLRCQSLPLRVWAYFDANGHEQPEWGFAVDKTLCLLPRVKGTCDASATGKLSLHGVPGGEQHAQVIVVPLAKDLREIQVTCKDLAGPAGQIPAAQIKVEPIDYTRLPEATSTDPQWWRGRLLLTKASVPRDMTQAYLLSVTIPAAQKPGKYSGRIYFAPANSQSMPIELTVEVADNTGEVKK